MFDILRSPWINRCDVDDEDAPPPSNYKKAMLGWKTEVRIEYT